MSRELPPFERPPRGQTPYLEEGARRRYNPFIIFGIAVFAVFAFYLSLVVVTQVDGLFFPGNEVRTGIFGKVLPGVDPGEPPSVVTIDDRINILFLGLDIRRDQPPDTPARTDSIFVLSLDPFSKTAGVFSIPRDTLVEIPDGFGGYVKRRINEAYEMGEYSYRDYPEGGVGLVIDTIERNFQIPINHYVILNFNNFIALIDELGGIDVEITEYAYDFQYSDCNSCPYYAVEFFPGVEHMDGERALAYARIRKSDNDFKRIERQQAVIRATAKRAMDLGILVDGNPLNLYRKYKSSVETDISDFLIPGLARLGQQIGVDNIKMVSMAPATYPCDPGICGGAAVLLWDQNKFEELKAQVFSDGRLQGEGAFVEVLNGTVTPDLAGEFAAFLRRQGLPSERILVDEYNNGELFNNTVIYDLSGKSYTVRKLAEWLNLPDTRILSADDPEAQRYLEALPTVDVVVILGSDAAVPDTTSLESAFPEIATAGG